MALEVPQWLAPENDTAAETEPSRFRDASNAMHGIFGFAGLSRSSEVGHRNYKPELAGEPMAERALLWLDVLRQLNRTFHRDGQLLPMASANATDLQIEAYPHGVYAYHMHHRAGRWADHGLEMEILRAELPYLVRPAYYLINEHLSEGRFYHDPEKKKFDKDSMAHGLAGIHGTVYGWVRWAKPEGAEDMGQLPEAQLAQWFGITPDALVSEVARPAAQRMLVAWDPDRGIYRFDDDDTWSLQTLGSLMRGSKAVYETLYMFGDGENDHELAEQIAWKTGTVLKSVFTLSEDWGLPDAIHFSSEGPEAASETVDSEALWGFVNHLGSGFALLSEDAGMSDFIANGPLAEIPEVIGAQIDRWLQFTLETGLHEGYLVESYDYRNGALSSEKHPVAAIGMFVVAASNNYRRGSAFERASDWDNVAAPVAERSRLLYDTLLAHTRQLEALFPRENIY